MFDNLNDVISIPERVFEFCKLAQKKGPISLDNLKRFFQPFEKTNDVNLICRRAEELLLIQQNPNDKTYFYSGDSANIKDIEAFRRYCNSIAWKDENSVFFKVASSFIKADDRWLKIENLTDSQIANEVSRDLNLQSWDPRYLLSERFWLSFLGFGFVAEKNQKIQFLPNMYVALKDFIFLSQLEPGKEYSAQAFFDALRPVCALGVPVKKTDHISLACSCGLRELHDSKEIEIRRNPDSPDIWRLVNFPSHSVVEEFTHIFYRGLK